MSRSRPSSRARTAAARPKQFMTTTAQIEIPATPVANPERTRFNDSFTLIPLDVVTLYGVFNNADRLQQLVDAGEMHPLMMDKMLEPLFTTEVAGEAKRETNRINRYRMEDPVNSKLGPAILREQTVTRTAWEDITGADFDEIDDGTRPNG